MKRRTGTALRAAVALPGLILDYESTPAAKRSAGADLAAEEILAACEEIELFAWALRAPTNAPPPLDSTPYFRAVSWVAGFIENAARSKDSAETLLLSFMENVRRERPDLFPTQERGH